MTPQVFADQLLELEWKRFYEADGDKPVPMLKAFVQEHWAAEERVMRLMELVAVDLECRWKPLRTTSAPVERWSLTDYLQEWPELRRSEVILELLEREIELREGNSEQPWTEIKETIADLLGAKVDGFLNSDIEKPQPDAPDVPGYRLIEEIGDGGQGSVWRARRNGLEVAVKVLKHCDLNGRVRFNQEIAALNKLVGSSACQSIVRIIDSEIEERPYYIAMEYCREGSLEKLLKERGRPLTPRSAANLIKLVAIGLHRVHSVPFSEEASGCTFDAIFRENGNHGIIHRDIKPSNIMLVAVEGEEFPVLNEDRLTRYLPKLTDFGMAKLRPGNSGFTQSDDLLGTPQYMSPEQANDARDVSKTADIYSLGAVLYRCLTGHPPFDGADPAQILIQIIESKKPIVDPRKTNPAIPRDLDVICMKCLRRNPSERYRSAIELADDLDRYLDGRPILARPIPAPAKVWRWCLRRRAIVFASASFVFLILGALIAATLSARSRAQLEEKRKTRVAKASVELAVSKRLLDETHIASSRLARQLTVQALAAANRADGVLQPADDRELRLSINTTLLHLETSERDHRLMIQLDEARLRATACGHETPFDWSNVEEGVLKAFEQYPLDIREQSVEEITSAFRDRPIGRELAASFDLLGRVAKEQRDRARYRTIAERLDPDPLRNRIRIALATEDPEQVKRLTQELELDNQPLATLLLLGSYLLEASAYSESEAVLHVAQSRFPHDFWVNLQLSACLFRASPAKPVEAIRFCTAAVALRSSSPGARSSMAAAFISARQDYDAEREARLALRLDSDLPEAKNNLAVALMRLYRLDEAEVAAREACEGRPNAVEMKITLGLIQYRRGRFTEAEELFREALKMRPNAYMTRSVLASVLAATGSIPEADRQSKLAVKNLPHRAEVLAARAYVLMQMGRYAEAKDMLNRALELTPSFVDARFLLAFTLAHLGEAEQGERMCQKALESHSRNAEGHIAHGVCLVLQGKRENASTAFKKALDACPLHPIAHQCLGQVYGEMGNWQAAAAHHRQAGELLPDWSVPISELAVAMAELRRWQEAEKLDRKAIALEPNAPRPYEHLAFLLQRTNRLQEARAALQHAVRLGDTKIDTHVRLLQVTSWLGDFEAIPKECHALQVLHPDNSEVAVVVAGFLANAREWDLAEAAVQHAIQLKPKNWDIHKTYLELLEFAGRYEDAIQHLAEIEKTFAVTSWLQREIAAWKKRIEQKQSLDEKLATVSLSTELPGTALDQIELARHAKASSRQQYLLALRLYQAAFTSEPKLAQDIRTALRSEAATAAALAACGLGDARDLAINRKSELHQQAIAWLRADMSQYKVMLNGWWPWDASSARTSMEMWRQTPDFAFVRGKNHTDKLPPSEKSLWSEFWLEVDQVLGQSDPSSGSPRDN